MLVIDVMMPGEDGISLTKALRKTLSVPILLLTARGETANRIEGLEAGADDYLVKPFEPKELLLRINAILRRVPSVAITPAPPRALHLGQVRYDIDRGELWRGVEQVRMTTTEAQLMRLFAAHPGMAIARERLVGDRAENDKTAGDKTGGDKPGAEPGKADDSNAQMRAVDVQITRLRRKIEEDPRQPRYLQTVRGEGYMLQPD